MKLKIVIKVEISCHKCRAKALKIAAGASGVESVTAQGDDAIVVTGKCVDPVELTATLRKKVGAAILLSVEEIKPPSKKEPLPPAAGKGEKEDGAAAGEKKNGGGEQKDKKIDKEDKPKEKQPKEEKEKRPATQPTPSCCSYGMPPPPYSCPGYNNYYYPQPQYCMYEIPHPDPNPPCSIM